MGDRWEIDGRRWERGGEEESYDFSVVFVI
jgi:hypothetical protein